MTVAAANSNSLSFLDAVTHQGPVKGYTHTLYKYPARFSPVFARSAIETFTSPGDTVLDPFVGGGTAMVEARLAGRNAVGSDINSLATFLTRTKAIPLSNSDLDEVRDWFRAIPERLNIHLPSVNLRRGAFVGYDRNMPWRLRKLCEQYLQTVGNLPTIGQQRFARCVLLRCGQWAMDCRKEIPSAVEFRETLTTSLSEAIAAMREYRLALDRTARANGGRARFRCVQQSADELSRTSFGNAMHKKAKLLLTSPPYPGVHVLYHRWNVRGRRESPAPYWLANCLDGHGSVHYTLGDRRQKEQRDYFAGIERVFRNLRTLLANDGLVIQLVAFASPEWQLDSFLKAMTRAGYDEALPQDVGIECSGRLWRPVPGRRWYSIIRGDIASSKEVVLFHRKK